MSFSCTCAAYRLLLSCGRDRTRRDALTNLLGALRFEWNVAPVNNDIHSKICIFFQPAYPNLRIFTQTLFCLSDVRRESRTVNIQLLLESGSTERSWRYCSIRCYLQRTLTVLLFKYTLLSNRCMTKAICWTRHILFLDLETELPFFLPWAA
jgi:hypothetical protein